MAEMNISKESDEVVEMFCEHCYEHRNGNNQAEGFCVNCVKYFCATCLKYHRQFLPDHVTQEKDKMPSDVYMEKCDQHSEELVKFYCLSCEEIACSICKTDFHKQCKEVHHLPKLALEFEKGKECGNIENSLDLIEKEVADVELLLSKGKQENKQYNADALSALRKQKADIDKIFDNFEQEIGKVHTANKDLLDKEEKSKDLLKADIDNLKAETEELKSSSQKCKIFLKTKNMKKEMKKIKEKLKGLKTELEKELCEFKNQHSGQRFQSRSFGRLIVGPRKVVKANTIPWCIVVLILALAIIFSVLVFDSNTHITVTKLSYINIDFYPRKICYYSEQSLLLLHYNSKTIHVFNPKDSNWTGKIHQPQLWDITRVRHDMIAATFSGTLELWKISSSESHFSKEVVKYINIDKNCEFTQYRLGNLFAFCPKYRENFRTIKIFDEKGNKLNSFIIDFVVRGMTVSPNGKTIYISRYKDSSITSYTTEGKVVAQFRNESLKQPTEMTMDSNGNLFVCGFSSHNIFYISADLTYGYEIINKSHGIEYPNSISYNERDSVLYVSSNAPIQVFKINLKRFKYFL